MALGNQYGLRWLSRPYISSLSFMVTESMDINIGSGCWRASHLDMALGCSSGLGVEMNVFLNVLKF